MNKKGGFKSSKGDVISQIRNSLKSIEDPAILPISTKPKSGSRSRYTSSQYIYNVPVATSVSRPKSRSIINGNKLKYVDELIPTNIVNIFKKLEHIYGSSVIHNCKKIVYDYLLDELNQIVRTIARNINNKEKYIWDYDPALPTGKYQIRIDVMYKDGEPVSAYSGFFDVINPAIIKG